MNIHIMSNDKFAAKFVWLIDNAYPKESNIIYIHSNQGKEKNIKSDNAKYIDSFDEIDFKLLNKTDKVFVHGFYNTSLVRFLYFKCRNINKQQLVLIIWGADLYDARAELKKPGVHIKTRINEFIKKRLISRCNKFMTFACSDFELICKWYNAKGQQFDCIYPTNANPDLLDRLLLDKKQHDKISILLGNSATPSNQHFLALKQLSVFADRNIEIICPLSYGDMKYAEKVSDYGKEIFGGKFVPINKFMSAEDYSILLNGIDIAVFFNDRQQATGNIEILAYLKKKIFIRSDTTTWHHYVERDECRFYDALNIQLMTFEDFISVDDESMMFNHKYIHKVWDIGEIKKLWDTVMIS